MLHFLCLMERISSFCVFVCVVCLKIKVFAEHKAAVFMVIAGFEVENKENKANRAFKSIKLWHSREDTQPRAHELLKLNWSLLLTQAGLNILINLI